MPSAAGAVGARFNYEVCDSALPGGGTPQVKFVHNTGEPFAAANTCSEPGGSLTISLTGTVQATYSFWNVGIPVTPGGEVEALGVSAKACGDAAINAFVISSGWPAKICSAIELYRVFHGSYSGVWVFLGCNGSVGPCSSGSVSAHYFVATEVDKVAPTVGDLHGSLLGAGTARGHQTIAADVSDEGGGLSEEAVIVNGILAGSPQRESCAVTRVNNSSFSGAVATEVTPCPQSRDAEWTLDTQAYPFRDGANSVQVCGYDFATIGDPNRGCTAPRKIEVDNSCTPSAIDGGEVLSAQFAPSNAETITTGYGRGAEVTGRLATEADDPVAGATLCVKIGMIGTGRGAASVGAVTTDAEGDYRYRLAPGPNRRVMIGYRHDSRQVAREVRAYTRAEPTLRLSPTALHNGRRLHLFGRLPGPRAARRIVVLQANAPGSRRWITFRRASTDKAGAFRSGYRFTSTTRRTRYRFRALVPRQDDYPWVEGHSKPATAVVSP
jgi:hypothetical protein